MLDKNEGHSGIDGKVLQESCKSLQPSGGGAYRDDWERGQRQQIILFGVPYNGTAVILRARCRLIIPAWCIHTRPGRTVGIEGTPRRLSGFSHDCLHSCEPRKGHCAVCSPFDYASLWSTASIEASRRLTVEPRALNRQSCSHCGAVGAGVNFHEAAEQPNALPHAGDSDTGQRCTSVQLLQNLLGYAAAVVGALEEDFAGLPAEKDLGRRAENA
jgi:hypothetical protein